MKKRYVLAIALAAFLRVQAQAQDVPTVGFEPQVTIPPQAIPVSMYAADLDGDGDQDVLSASYLDKRIIWYSNNGEGDFELPQLVTTQASNFRVVYASDLDGDGDQDVLSSTTDGDKIFWYENDGQGNFGEERIITTQAARAESLYTADLDGDGDPDVLSASFDDNKIAWYENDGQGNFGEQQIISTQVDRAESIYAADLDGDGDQDVLSASTLDDKIAWYENNGQGNFGEQQIINDQADGATSVYAADLDGDGDQDVLSASASFNDNEIAWYQNDGQGNFQLMIIDAQNFGGQSVYAADLDGDGDQDVLAAFSNNTVVVWYENDGQGNFAPPITLDSNEDFGYQGVYTADLDDDGDQDVLSVTSSTTTFSWYRNDGQANFEKQQVPLPLIENGPDVYADDLDGDGDQDVLSVENNELAWQQNDGQGNFSEPKIISTQVKLLVAVYTADLDGDGDQDVLSASSDDKKIAWYENDGQGNFGEQQIIAIADSPVDVYAADLDGDGDQDVLLGSSDSEVIVWYANDGQENFERREISSGYDILSSGRDIHTDDLDGDGDQDILSAFSFQYPEGGYLEGIVWYKNDGQGNFSERQLVNPVGGVVSIYTTDVDGDGNQDVLSAAFRSNEIAWHRNNGQGGFEEARLISRQAEGAQEVYATDLDGDGDMDVLSASSFFIDRKIAWYENDGKGNFGEQLVISTFLPGVDDVYVADLNGDGAPDVLSPFRINGEVVWFKNVLSSGPSVPSITELTLFNARTDAKIDILEGGDEIDLLNLDLRDYNIQANVVAAGETITRVNFDLTAPARQDTMTTEFKLPYALYGDKPNGDFRPRKAYDGDYQLTVTPYYQDSTGKETKGVSKTVSFTFVARGLRARNIRMIDTRDNSIIESLDNGDVISLARNQPVSILVDSRYPQYNSMEFFLDGPSPDGIDEVRALENLVPYAIFGDDGLNTDPNGRPLAAGEYEVRVIPYQGKNRDSYAGPEEVVRFTVVRPITTRQELAYPVPFTHEVNLRTEPVDMSQLRVRFVHSYGQVYEVSSDQITVTEDGLLVNVADLPAGSYTIQLQQADRVQTFRGSKE